MDAPSREAGAAILTGVAVVSQDRPVVHPNPLCNLHPGGQVAGGGENGLAGGKMADERASPELVEFGKHIVEQQHGRSSGGFCEHVMGAEAQGQCQRTLLALRRVRSRRQALGRRSRRLRRAIANWSSRPMPEGYA